MRALIGEEKNESEESRMSANNNLSRPGSARPQRETAAGSEQTARRAYQPPALTRYGDVRGLTLGGSPGTGDSGGPNQSLHQGGP